MLNSDCRAQCATFVYSLVKGEGMPSGEKSSRCSSIISDQTLARKHKYVQNLYQSPRLYVSYLQCIKQINNDMSNTSALQEVQNILQFQQKDFFLFKKKKVTLCSVVSSHLWEKNRKKITYTSITVVIAILASNTQHSRNRSECEAAGAMDTTLTAYGSVAFTLGLCDCTGYWRIIILVSFHSKGILFLCS